MDPIITDFEIREELFLGNALVKFDVSFDSGSKKFTVPIAYSDIKIQLLTSDPEQERYLAAIRTNIGGWGPKEIQVVQKANEEGFDWMPGIASFCSSDFGKRMVNQYMNMPALSQEDIQKMKDIYLSMKQISESVKFTTNEVCELIQDAVHEAVLKRFPLVEKAQADHYIRLNEIYTRQVSTFAEALTPLLHDISEAVENGER